MNRPAILVVFLALALGCKPSGDRTVRAAVIGGMVTSGMWAELAAAFEKQTGWKVEVVATGPKEVIGPAFRDGKADLLTMHSSDVVTELVAGGFGRNMRPWARNELVLLAPPGDPAGISGMNDGAAALRKIHDGGCQFIDARGSGKRIIAERLWKKAGLDPAGTWIVKDESTSATDLLAFAERRGAYVLCGRIPVLTGKLPPGRMTIAVRGDPDMQRPYVVIEADPANLPGSRTEGARALADFLTGPDGQEFLRRYAATQPLGIPMFFPLSE